MRPCWRRALLRSQAAANPDALYAIDTNLIRVSRNHRGIQRIGRVSSARRGAAPDGGNLRTGGARPGIAGRRRGADDGAHATVSSGLLLSVVIQLGAELPGR